jgi:hypothetical protein
MFVENRSAGERHAANPPWGLDRINQTNRRSTSPIASLSWRRRQRFCIIDSIITPRSSRPRRRFDAVGDGRNIDCTVWDARLRNGRRIDLRRR